MTAIEQLTAKLKELGIVNINVFRGDDWFVTTPEQRAQAILDVLKAIEERECTECVLNDHDEDDADAAD